MKKLITCLLFALAMFIVKSEVQAQTTTVNVGTISSTTDYAGYMAVKDTLTNTDTTIYIVDIRGPRHNISFSCDVIKLTGTVAGKFDVYGSVNGDTYETAVITSVTKTDATANYVIKLTANSYQKYKILSISSGTNTHSQRSYLLARRLP